MLYNLSLHLLETTFWAPLLYLLSWPIRELVKVKVGCTEHYSKDPNHQMGGERHCNLTPPLLYNTMLPHSVVENGGRRSNGEQNGQQTTSSRRDIHYTLSLLLAVNLRL